VAGVGRATVRALSQSTCCRNNGLRLNNQPASLDSPLARVQSQFTCQSSTAIRLDSGDKVKYPKRRSKSEAQSHVTDTPALVEAKFKSSAESSMRTRHAIAFSEHNHHVLERFTDLLALKYPVKSHVHLVDFSFTNGLLTRQLLRDKWPRISSLEPYHLGNLYNILALSPPSFTHHDFSFEDFFFYQKQNYSRSKLRSSFCDRYMPRLPTEIVDSIRPQSISYETLCGTDETRVVAAGVFGDTVRLVKSLLPFGKSLHYRATRQEDKTMLKPVDIFAYVPQHTAQQITDPKLQKLRREKFFLDFYCKVEVLDVEPCSKFNLYYAPKSQFDMKLLHIQPRPDFETAQHLGIKVSDLDAFAMLFHHCAYSPVRPLRQSLVSWTPDLDGYLTPEQLNASLRDITIQDLADIYLRISSTDSFRLLQESWTHYFSSPGAHVLV
jgi:hypothetical protein